MEHLIQFPNPDQNEWKMKYISQLRAKLESSKTDGDLTVNLCTVIAKWMNTSMVIANEFP